MEKHVSTSSGFTAVELLITLFVAALFLAAGYTLYDAIINRSSEARQTAQADNIAYDYLRRYEATVAVPCAASTPLNRAALTGDAVLGLANPLVTVSVTCPFGSTLNRVSKVTVTIEYGDGGNPRSVQHEVLATTNS